MVHGPAFVAKDEIGKRGALRDLNNDLIGQLALHRDLIYIRELRKDPAERGEPVKEEEVVALLDIYRADDLAVGIMAVADDLDIRHAEENTHHEDERDFNDDEHQGRADAAVPPRLHILGMLIRRRLIHMCIRHRLLSFRLCWAAPRFGGRSVFKKNVRAEGAQTDVEALIPAGDVPVVKYHGLPIRGEAGHYHRRAAAKVGGIQRRAVQAVHAPYLRAPPLRDYIRAETPKLRHLTVTVFKNVLRDDRLPLSAAISTGCASVGKPGYGCVDISPGAFRRPVDFTRTARLLLIISQPA